MRKVYSFDVSDLYYCDKEEYEDFLYHNDCWNTSFLLCAKNPFHKDIVGYDRNCPKGHPEYLCAHRPLQHLMALNMIDAKDPKFFSDEMIDKGLEFIQNEMDNRRDVIVVCNLGESRSPTMCLMYLMAHGDIPKDKEFKEIANDYIIIAPEWNPNDGILSYCERFWERVRKEL